MNVFWAELRAHRRATIGWALSLAAVVVVFMALFPAFAADVATSRALLERFPPALRAIFGLSIDKFFTVYGFYAYLQTFVTLIAAVQATNLGVAVLAREDALKTTDFLLTKPVSRSRVVSAKLAAVVVVLLLTNVVVDVAGLVAAAAANQGPLDVVLFVLLLLNVAIVQAAFLAFGLLLGAVLPKVKSPVAVSLPAVFLFFVFGMLDAILGSEPLRYLTPFKYVDPLHVIDQGGYEWRYLASGGAVALVAVGLSYLAYVRKDFRAVA